MKTLVNGEQCFHASVYDRGLLYGQTVFETIAVANGKPCLLKEHLSRMQKGALVLGIPFDSKTAQTMAEEVASVASEETKAVIRATLSMGEGGRGYADPLQPRTNRIVSLHAYPDHNIDYWKNGINLGVADIRLASQPALAGIKHGNRLEQIMARRQWQDDWQEALVLDQSDKVVEATQSNIFVVKGSQLLTPDLTQCGVAGVMREYVLAMADKLGLSPSAVSLSLPDIEAADELFVTNSVVGLWPVKRLNSTTYSTFNKSHKLLNYIIKDEVIPNY